MASHTSPQNATRLKKKAKYALRLVRRSFLRSPEVRVSERRRANESIVATSAILRLRTRPALKRRRSMPFDLADEAFCGVGSSNEGGRRVAEIAFRRERLSPVGHQPGVSMPGTPRPRSKWP